MWKLNNIHGFYISCCFWLSYVTAVLLCDFFSFSLGFWTCSYNGRRLFSPGGRHLWKQLYAVICLVPEQSFSLVGERKPVIVLFSDRVCLQHHFILSVLPWFYLSLRLNKCRETGIIEGMPHLIAVQIILFWFLMNILVWSQDPLHQRSSNVLTTGLH